MFKKHSTISTEAQVLLKLIRLALGTEPIRYFGEPVDPFPTNINWKEVIRLSYQHKVSALAVDGLKSSGYNIYNGLNDQQKQELKAIVEPWFRDVAKTEHSYAYYLEVLNTICHICIANGLTPIILKGYGLSLNYPIPSHRGAGDIDIYLTDDKGDCAAEKGNLIAKKFLSANVKNEDDEHHSQFMFKGICVENHYELTGTCWRRKEDTWFNELLKKMISRNTECANNFYIPSTTFTYLFLIHHMFTHFYFGLMAARQFSDYVTFLRHHSEAIDWNVVNEAISTSHLNEFLDGINGVATTHFGLNTEHIPLYNKNEYLTARLYSDMMCIQDIPCNGKYVLLHYYVNRWHYRYFRRKNWFEMLLCHFTSYLKAHANK